MKFLFINLALLLIFSVGYSQELSNKYTEYTTKAFKLYQKKKFTESKDYYQLAFTSSGDRGRVIDRYNFAACWVALNKPDSAFVQLQRIAEKGKFSSFDLLSMDGRFEKLQSDRRWPALLEKVKQNKENQDNN